MRQEIINHPVLHVSTHNHKLGRIPSVSLPPLLTCVDNPPCASLCYARKAYDNYSYGPTHQAWGDNLLFYQTDPAGYFDAIETWLRCRRKLPGYFRWHVSGDMPDQDYLRRMVTLAQGLPAIRFLAYTRRDYPYTGDYSPNLVLVKSLWLDENHAVKHMPWFKVLPAHVPASCPGSCTHCHTCWYLNPGQGVTINLH